VLARHPDLNVLVTMAGIMRVEDWRQPESFLASAEATVTTNVLGPIRLIAAFIQHLQAQPDATIITVSSGRAFAPLRVTPSYNASKPPSTCSAVDPAAVRRHDREGCGAGAARPHRPAARPGGQRIAMPLDDYADQVVALLKAQPDVQEIQVERVKFLRYGEARGDYARSWRHSTRPIRTVNNGRPCTVNTAARAVSNGQVASGPRACRLVCAAGR
jgi:short-subunit dehydrogenase involved in D-alanine esterification of teichoic acids